MICAISFSLPQFLHFGLRYVYFIDLFQEPNSAFINYPPPPFFFPCFLLHQFLAFHHFLLSAKFNLPFILWVKHLMLQISPEFSLGPQIVVYSVSTIIQLKIFSNFLWLLSLPFGPFKANCSIVRIWGSCRSFIFLTDKLIFWLENISLMACHENSISPTIILLLLLLLFL